MKTYKSSIESLLAEKQTVSGIRGNVREALKSILTYGFATTGESGRYGKYIWTEKVANVLRSLNIPCKTGNEAPRGGANGEFVIADAPEFRAEVLANRYDQLLSMGTEYKTYQEKQDELNASIDAFIANPQFRVDSTEDHVNIYNNQYEGDILARRNFLEFKTVCLPIIAQIFKENGVEVTIEELDHNFQAWRNDFKSGIVTASGWFIFTPCGCNDLCFRAERNTGAEYQKSYYA